MASSSSRVPYRRTTSYMLYGRKASCIIISSEHAAHGADDRCASTPVGIDERADPERPAVPSRRHRHMLSLAGRERHARLKLKKYRNTSLARNGRLEHFGYCSSSAHTNFDGEDEPVPTAPPLDILDSVPGYESLGFDAVCVPPPPPEATWSEPSGPPPRDPVHVGGELSEQQARAALLCHVTDHCCYGRGAARHMNIAKINYSSAHHYELQTFTEKRETSWTFVPYSGGEVDSPSCGEAPEPWSVPAEPAQLFHDEVKVMEVPHTASAKDCHRCKGQGSLSCAECHGKGWTRCLSCHGNGWSADSSGYRERCYYCQASAYGDGKQDCLKCNAKGRVACPPCDSYGQVRCYIRLTISWKVTTSEHIVEHSSLPEELIREVSGQVAVEEEAAAVAPLTHYPDAAINLASAQLILEHQQKLCEQRVLAQRHQVRVVPVAEVNYTHKSHSGRFWVYGYENKVHAPDYPDRHCWGCCSLL
ncbi:protein SSUH2 homolog [Amphibalanus amphitrite]|uniref:protein SSUH2 homolog n=1 Tax=Amphibalanus amphitrite TaxID=1232801 RepID=UPI001C90EEE2|nr:protein SSUH2 homolog [Amphibalanus amphitrite]